MKALSPKLGMQLHNVSLLNVYFADIIIDYWLYTAMYIANICIYCLRICCIHVNCVFCIVCVVLYIIVYIPK